MIDCDAFDAARSSDVLRGTSELVDVLNIEENENRVVLKSLVVEGMLVVVKRVVESDVDKVEPEDF